MSEPTKAERLEEFLGRLREAALVGSEREALDQLSAILTEVEDRLTSIPNHPDSWQTDGRLYPPQLDSRRPERPGIARYRSRRHNTLIAENGAIEIRTGNGELLLSKPGSDGKEVKDI